MFYIQGMYLVLIKPTKSYYFDGYYWHWLIALYFKIPITILTRRSILNTTFIKTKQNRCNLIKSYLVLYMLVNASDLFMIKSKVTDTHGRSYRGITPQIANRVYIDASAVLVGDITLADDVSIWPLVAARGDVNTITIGARTNIQDGTVLHVTRKSSTNPEGNLLAIGEDVTVGHKCMLHGCVLGDRILVGMGAIIMDGVIVEDDVFIGAGSLVPPNKVLKSGYLYVGNPVKQARLLKDSEANFLKQSAINYVQLKNEYIEHESV